MTFPIRSACLLLALASQASAQGVADFDQLPEGFVGASLVTPVGTFQDLVLDGLGTPGMFAVDNGVAQLGNLNRFSSPNVLSLGDFMPGPYVYPEPVKSFRLLLSQPSSAIRMGLFLENLPAANTVEVSFWSNGQPGSTWSIGGGSGITSHTIEQCDNPGQYDEIRVRGLGPVDGGRFRGMVDTIVIANAQCGSAPSFCAADVTGGCPCGNEPAPNSQGGCLNSLGRSGLLTGFGIASLAADEMVLAVSGLPSFGSLIVAQSAAAPVPASQLGDGVWCLPGSAQRILSLVVNQAGNAAYPAPGNVTLSVRGNVTAPGTRHYQAAYRNGSSYCTPAVFNTTSGVSITWGP